MRRHGFFSLIHFSTLFFLLAVDPALGFLKEEKKNDKKPRFVPNEILLTVRAPNNGPTFAGNSLAGNLLDQVQKRLIKHTKQSVKLSVVPFSTDSNPTAPRSFGVGPSNTPQLMRVRLSSPINNLSALLKLTQSINQAEKTEDPDQVSLEASPNYIAYALLPSDQYFPPSQGAWGQSFPDLWGLQKINVAGIWDDKNPATRGQGQIVAVIDTGVDYNHPDLKGQVVKGWNFVANTQDPMDDHGHGTHVAGTIAALAKNITSNFEGGVVGVAPLAKIMPIKVLNEYGSGTYADIISGITYAADHGATVINMSLGGKGDSPPMAEAIQYAHDKGVVVVVAAGNEKGDVSGYNCNAETTDPKLCAHVPANDPNAITVSAFDESNSSSSFSNYGTKISVAGPGGSIDMTVLSAKASKINPYLESRGLVVGTQFLRLSGTSMATPHVAGVAAIVRALHPSYSPEQVRQAIQKGSDSITNEAFDVHYGFGKVNARGAASQIDPLEAQITSPLGKVVGSTVLDIMGSAQGPNFRNWKLDYGVGKEPTTWITLASSNQSVANDKLASVKAEELAQGLLTLRLTAFNTAGVAYEYRQNIFNHQVYFISPEPSQLAFARGEEITITGNVSSSSFRNYNLSLIKNSSTVPEHWAGTPIEGKFKLPENGLKPVLKGVLGIWDTSGLEKGQYTVILTVNLTDGEPIISRLRFEVDPTLRKGFPMLLPGIAFQNSNGAGILTMADLIGDGKKEMLLVLGGQVHALLASGQELAGWPQSIASSGSIFGYAQGPAVGDINGDGKVEIVAGDAESNIYAWSADGNILPGYPVRGKTQATNIAISDIDGDGKNEIITSSSHSNSGLWVLDGLGNEKPGWIGGKLGSTGKYLSAPAIGDVFKQGKKAIAVQAIGYLDDNETSFPLYLFNSDGSLAPGWPVNIPRPNNFPYASWSQPIMGDLFGDGRLEILVNLGPSVYAFYPDGSSVRGFPTTTATKWPVNGVSLADLDRDGLPEIVAGCSGDDLYVYKSDGTNFPGFPINNYPQSPPDFNGAYGSIAWGFTIPVNADVTGSGIPSILVSGDLWTGGVQAFQTNGKMARWFPKSTVGLTNSSLFEPKGFAPTPLNGAAVGDLDGNNKVDVAYLDDRGYLFVYELPVTASGPMPWPMVAHDPSRSYALPSSPRNPPTITSIDKFTGPVAGGQTLTISGIAFYQPTVKIGRNACPITGVVTSSEIRCIVPKGEAGEANVVVTNRDGKMSSSVKYTYFIPRVPDAISNLNGTAGNAKVDLDWVAPGNSGTSPITDYGVEYSSDSGKTWLTYIDGVSTKTTASVGGLKNGTTYTFRVYALNSEGKSSYSPASKSLTPVTVPTAPREVSGTAGNTKVDLSWLAPENNGGSAITDYGVEYSSDSGKTWLTYNDGVSTKTTASVVGLKNGTLYSFRVYALNSVGKSSYSPASKSLTPVTVPTAPREVSGTAGNTKVDLSWLAPENNGGSAISDYGVEYSSDSGKTWLTYIDGVSTKTIASVVGLKNGTAYVFRVYAMNSVGKGAYSPSSKSFAPVTVPTVPRELSGTAGNAKVTLSWVAPENDGGSPITDYVIEYSANNGKTWVVFNDGISTKTTVSVVGLANRTSYLFRILAVNTVGKSPYTPQSKSLTPGWYK